MAVLFTYLFFFGVIFFVTRLDDHASLLSVQRMCAAGAALVDWRNRHPDIAIATSGEARALVYAEIEAQEAFQKTHPYHSTRGHIAFLYSLLDE